jgi:anaerobic magnesium-protoporphyrin IX monomethyl ester cyclase
MEEVKDALCLGISVVIGPMIRETVDVAKMIKKWTLTSP